MRVLTAANGMLSFSVCSAHRLGADATRIVKYIANSPRRTSARWTATRWCRPTPCSGGSPDRAPGHRARWSCRCGRHGHIMAARSSLERTQHPVPDWDGMRYRTTRGLTPLRYPSARMTDSHEPARPSRPHVAEAAGARAGGTGDDDPGAPLQRRRRRPATRCGWRSAVARRGTSRCPRGSSARRPPRSSPRSMAAGFDLLILDGEAAPVGGMGLCSQLKDEIYRLPADPGAHRPPAGRLARHLVAGRRRRAAPARPDRARRGRRRRWRRRTSPAA